MRRSLPVLVLFAIANLAVAATAPVKFSFGRFGAAVIYQPPDVRHVALFFSDERGWSARDVELAQALAGRGVLVAGIDLRHYAQELAKPRDKCSYLAGEFEDFSHELQKHFSPQRYHMPVLIGAGRGAGLVYGVAAQGSSGTFVGTLTIGFKPQWPPLTKLCQSYGLRYESNKDGSITFKPTPALSTPWIAMQSDQDGIRLKELAAFVTATNTGKLVSANDSPSGARATQLGERLLTSVEELARPDQDAKVLADELRDLPLEEVRAQGRPNAQLALFLTGDGGWAEIDKGVSAQLAQRGIDVIALSSLQYFWKPRSPDETAKDVARVLRHYLAAWNKHDVLLIGYSFGADIAPFVVNRLPMDLRSKIRSISLLGLATTADFEVHVTTWLGVDHHGLAIRPEVDRLTERVLCVYGEGEQDSLCPQLIATNVSKARVGDGHHFGDRYQELAERILTLESGK